MFIEWRSGTYCRKNGGQTLRHSCVHVRFFFLFDRSICPALLLVTRVGSTPVGYLLLIEMMSLDGAFVLVSTQRLVLF